MKKSYEEDLANHFGLDPYTYVGNSMRVASVRGTGRRAIELRNQLLPSADRTHQCSKTLAHGRFIIRRESIAKRLRVKLAAIKLHLRRHWNAPRDQVGNWHARVAKGWMNYHAVSGNIVRLQQFRHGVSYLWLRQLRRNSQRHRWTWKRMTKLANRYLPCCRIIHPYPHQRFHARLKARAV